jgi:uncharacterized membrane protein YhhN
VTDRRFDLSDRLLLLAALAAACAYGTFAAGAQVSLAWALIKGIPMTALALLAVRHRGREGAALLAAALAIHAAGDVLLELAPLLAGVGAFLAGHLAYAALFVRLRESWARVRGGAKLRLGLLLLAVGAAAPVVVAGAPAPLRLPIAAYAAALTAMAALAQLTRRGVPVGLGALLFVASDALLGAGWFGGAAIPGGRGLVWPLYVGGQLSIALGVLRGGKTGS